MRIEQLRETGDARPALTTSNFDGVTRADALRELLMKHDFELARGKEELEDDFQSAMLARDRSFAAEHLDGRTPAFSLRLAGLFILLASVVHGQEPPRTITIPHGSITMSGPRMSPAEAAAILKADHEDERRALLARSSRWDGPRLVVAPCWTCDVQRLRDARAILSEGRTFNRLDVDSWRTSRPLYGRLDRTVIDRERRAKR